MEIRKKGLATAVLAASAAGAAGFGWLSVSTGGFLPGLFAHGCLAATIGGLADWFAVTAIFRKPLGISYRTEILRRNRPRIMRSLADFVGNDLLNRENVALSLSKQDFSEMLSRYLVEKGGCERILALSDALFTRSLETMDMSEVTKVFEPSLRHVFSDIRIDEIARRTITAALENGTIDRLLQALIPIIRAVWHDEALQKMLLASIGNIREAYVGNQSMRATLFDTKAFSDGRLLDRLNKYTESWFDEMDRGEGDTYRKLSQWAASQLGDAKRQEQLISRLRQWQIGQIETADISDRLTRSLELIREKYMPVWRKKLHDYLKSEIENFLADTEAKNKFNDMVLQWICNLLAAHHEGLPQMMERHLTRMTDDELVELVETHVEDDLQMIRINGAAVGSVVGVLLYVLTKAAERMWA